MFINFNFLKLNIINPNYSVNPKIVYCIIFILFFSGCVKPPEIQEPGPAPLIESGAYILNEGNFQWGNARLDYVNLNTGEISKDVFKRINNRVLGDVLQSAIYVKGNIWLVVNNSGKIEVINPKDCQSIRTINGLQSPRYALPVSEDWVWVSDLYANGIHIVSSGDLEKKGFIPLPGWTEQMHLHTSGVWVTNVRSQYVYLLDPGLNQLVDSVDVGLGNQNIVEDLAGNIWILSSGDVGQNIPGRISCIDPERRQIIQQFILDTPDGHSLEISIDRNSLFYIYAGSVWKLSTQANSLPAIPIVSGTGNQIFYGLSVHPKSELLYVLDAQDYVSEGRAYEYSYSGELKREIISGIIPRSMIFIK